MEPERVCPTCGLTMVLLATVVCRKAGKAIVSRQFVEMTRTWIEGLLAAFPKLMNTGRQHTFVETESARYVYQSMEKLHEMDSHEKKVFRAVRETQEGEAKAEMQCKAKELQQARRDAERRGKKAPGFGGFGSSAVSGGSTAAMTTETIIETDKPKVAPAPARPSGPSKALKLGAKGKEVDNFVDKLKSEGETIMSSNMGKRTSEATKMHALPINMESVHMKIEEKITLTWGRDGGLQNMELHGMIMLRISDEKFGRIRLHVENED
ncbi:hypothetical protein ACRRTK_013965 [Alexandromys fortis]